MAIRQRPANKPPVLVVKNVLLVDVVETKLLVVVTCKVVAVVEEVADPPIASKVTLAVSGELLMKRK